MIYLIGGAPRSGKTILSKKIANQKDIPWISTDTIRPMIIACTPKEQLDEKFPEIKLWREQNGQPYEDLRNSTPNELLQIEIKESKSLWPSIRAMIEHQIECKLSYVVEGVHLMPELIQQLMNEPYRNEVSPIFLIKSDLRNIKEGFSKNASNHDWLEGALSDKQLVNQAALMVQAKSLYIANEARKYGFKVIDTGEDFEEKINNISL